MYKGWLVLALLLRPLCGQIVTGSISGGVADPSGLPVLAAEVKLVEAATARTRLTQTGDRGQYSFNALDAGNYTLTVSCPGFKTFEQSGIVLATGERLPLGTATLAIGVAAEVISVTARAGAVVQTQSAERADVITGTQVDGLLIRGRNVKDLMGLLPGVVVTNEQDDLNSASTMFVQGNRQTMNNISVDGVPATDMGNGSMLKITVSQDAVAEVKMLISSYQAEYGRLAGSNVQIVTKSGARAFHGLGSYFKRHEQFNANGFFNNQNGISKPRYRYNTWTYNLSGPIYLPGKFNRNRERLFFFWQQEFWPTKSTNGGKVTVPTAIERAGDFSQSVDLNNRPVAVRDPYNSGAPFPGNVIPAPRLNRDGQALLKMFNAPNFLDRNISRGLYNYVFVSPNDLPKQTNTLKVDYNLNSNNTIVAGLSTFSDDHAWATEGANWPQMAKTRRNHPKSWTARYTRILSPRLLNEFSFGWLSQPTEDTYSQDALRRNQRDSVGFQAGQFHPETNPLHIVPDATFGGVPGAAQIGTEGRFPLFNRYNLFNWSDNFTVSRGAHTFKVGVYAELFFRHQKKAVQFNGAFDFGRSANNPLDTNYAYANAALGVFNSYTESSGAGWMRVTTGGTELFAQDSWRVTRRLTLDYGLRMYFLRPIYERDNRLSAFVRQRFDPKRQVRLIQPALDAQGRRVGMHPITGQIYPAAQIGAIAPGYGDPYNGMVVAGAVKDYPRAMVENRGAQWGPRFGFAYDASGNGKTAIRGGFGLFYNRMFTEGFSNAFIAQAPLLEQPVIAYGELTRLLTSSGLLYPNEVGAADARGLLPMVMNYSLSVQRDIGYGTVLDAGYAGTLGRHLPWRRDINPVPLGANFQPANFDPTLKGKPLPSAFLRPYAGYANITMLEGASSSNYHSLQVSAKRRFAAGLQFGFAWTWSKAMDFNDTDTASVSPLIPVRVWNYGLASFDRTHVVKINYVWDVPVLRAGGRLGRQLFEGWQLSGITSFVSGAPQGIGWSSTTPQDTTGTPSQGARVVVTANPALPKGERTFYRNFRTEVFRAPASGTIGNAAKNLLRGPGINNWDVALFKSFPLREKMRLQLRWELYNIFNHTQFSDFDTSARFDPVTGEQVNSRFGQFTAARAPRQMQLALRFSF